MNGAVWCGPSFRSKNNCWKMPLLTEHWLPLPGQETWWGWYPEQHWKGDNPMEETGRELWAYSTQTQLWTSGNSTLNYQATEGGLQMLVGSLGLAVGLRSNPEDRLKDAPINLLNALQNWKLNWGCLSEIASIGNPCNLKICSFISWAVYRVQQIQKCINLICIKLQSAQSA